MTNKATCAGCGAHLSAIYRGEPCPNGCDNPPTPSIVEFITARLDEDEQIAQAPTEAHWTYRPYRPQEGGWGDVVGAVGGGDGLDALVDPAEGEHIARQDPARVLRQVAAMRELVEWVEPETSFLDGGLRALASIWSNHPDYQAEWKP